MHCGEIFKGLSHLSIILVLFCGLWKTHSCMLFPNCTRNNAISITCTNQTSWLLYVTMCNVLKHCINKAIRWLLEDILFICGPRNCNLRPGRANVQMLLQGRQINIMTWKKSSYYHYYQYIQELININTRFRKNRFRSILP